jgi:hypothetical protein
VFDYFVEIALASNKAFIVNASEQGGVLLQICNEGQMPVALHIAKQAYQQAAD